MRLDGNDVRRAVSAGELLEMAALDPSGIGTAFPELARLLNASMFQLFNFTDPQAPDLIVANNCRGIVDDYLGAGWHAFDVYSHSAARFPEHGLFIGDHRLLESGVRSRDPFYGEFCRTWDIGGFTSHTFNLAGERWAFTLMSHFGAPLDDWGLAMMQHLAPAANRAALLAAIAKDARVHGIAAGLEYGKRPAFVLDHRGKVVLFSPSAEGLLGDDLFLRGGELHARDAMSDRSLKRVTVSAGFSRPSRMSNFTVRRHGRRPLFVMPIAVRDRGLDGLPGARIILIVSDVEAQTTVSRAILSDVFDFSPREAELAQLIANGCGIQSAAEIMLVSESTVRHMLKSMFSKAGVNRQAELVALLAKAASNS